MHGSGLIPGLRNALHSLGDLLVENMRIAASGFQVGMIERALHQLQVPGLAQELRGEVMPEIVESESADASALAQPTPRDLDAVVGEYAARPSLGRHACVGLDR